MKNDNERDAGWALVSVLWAVSVLSLLALAAQDLVLTANRFEAQMLRKARLDGVFEAAISRAVVGLSERESSIRWRADGTAYPLSLGDTKATIALQSELGRVDLNAGDGSTIRRVIHLCGLSEEASQAITDSILAWRTASAGTETLHGVSDADYKAAGKRYLPRHGPFQRLDELKLVLGVTPELFDCLRPALTLYNHHPSVDTAIAPPLVLRALYGDDAAQAEIQRRSSTFISVDSLSPPPGGQTFDIDVHMELSGNREHRGAVVMLTADQRQPFIVLDWR